MIRERREKFTGFVTNGSVKFCKKTCAAHPGAVVLLQGGGGSFVYGNHPKRLRAVFPQSGQKRRGHRGSHLPGKTLKRPRALVRKLQGCAAFLMDFNVALTET